MTLLTGATGRLGPVLLERLRATGTPVTAVAGPSDMKRGATAGMALNLSDAASVEALWSQTAPDVVIHTAALTDLEKCEAEPALARRANATAVENLARCCALDGSKLLVISTDGVFDGRAGNYRETDAPSPINQYAATKLAGEQAALSLCPERAVVLRTNFVGSRNPSRPGLAEWILARLGRGETVPGFTDAIFSPLHVELLADAVLAVLRANLAGLFHVGSSDSVSKFDFARRLARRCGYDEGLVVPEQLSQAGFKAERPRNLSLAVEKIEAALARPMPSVEKVLGRFSGPAFART